MSSNRLLTIIDRKTKRHYHVFCFLDFPDGVIGVIYAPEEDSNNVTLGIISKKGFRFQIDGCYDDEYAPYLELLIDEYNKGDPTIFEGRRHVFDAARENIATGDIASTAITCQWADTQEKSLLHRVLHFLFSTVMVFALAIGASYYAGTLIANIVLSGKPAEVDISMGQAVGHAPDDTNAHRDYESSLALLSAHEWPTLTDEQRIDLLQKIADYECAQILGCSYVTIGLEESDGVLGRYYSHQDIIAINRHHFVNGDAKQVLDTLLHEIRHHFQDSLREIHGILSEHDAALLENSIFADTRAIAGSLDNYISPQESKQDYYRQPAEVDARAYATERIAAYYSKYL